MVAEIVGQVAQRFRPARIGEQAHALGLARQQGAEPLGLPPRRAQEFADIGVAAVGKLRRRALRQQPAAAHHRDPVGEQNGFGHVMGDHDGGQAELAMQFAKIVAERVAGEGVERAERLVHQHDARLCGERARHADALALAAGKFVRQAVAILRAVEPHQIEQFIHPRGNLGWRRARQLRRDADIVGDAQMRKQPAALEHIADPSSQQDRIDVAYVLAFNRDRAGVRFDQPVGEPQQRGLAGTGAADDGQKLSFGDLERDVVDGHHATGVKGLADIRIGDQGRGRHSERSQPSAVSNVIR